MLKKLFLPLIVLFCPPAFSCDELKLEDSTSKWQSALDWMGPSIKPKSNADGSVTFNFEVVAGHKSRIERIFFCGDSDDNGKEGNEIYRTEAKSIRIEIANSLSTSAIVKFRLFDPEGNFYEWPLGVVSTKKIYTLEMPARFNTAPANSTILPRLMGFHFEFDRSAENSVLTSDNSQRAKVTLYSLNFSKDAAPASAIKPQEPVFASVDLKPYSQTILSKGTRATHLIFNAGYISNILKRSLNCLDNESPSCEPCETAECIQKDIDAAVAYAKLARARACTDATTGNCQIELAFGVAGLRQELTPAQWTERWPIIKSRALGLFAKLDELQIPYYWTAGNGSSIDIREPATELGESFLQSSFARGFYLAETTEDTAAGTRDVTILGTTVTYKIPALEAIGRLLDYAKNAGGQKVLIHHRMSTSWWNYGLYSDRLAVFKNRADTYVPAWEMVDPSAYTLNLLTTLGFWAGGWSNSFGVSTQSWGWNNMRWGANDSMRAQDWLRMWTVGVATGANYIQIEPIWAFAGGCAMTAEDKELFSDTEVSLADCDPDAMERLEQNLIALKTFHQWVRQNIVVSANEPKDLLTLHKTALQIKNDDHSDFDSVAVANLRPGGKCFSPETYQALSATDKELVPVACRPGCEYRPIRCAEQTTAQCFASAAFGHLPPGAQQLVPLSCQPTSTCNSASPVMPGAPNICAENLDAINDHWSALINVAGINHMHRSRILPGVDIFSRLYGNSHIYEGVMPQMPMGLLPIVGVDQPPSGINTVEFSGANAKTCGATKDLWCTGVKEASDALVARIEQQASSLSLSVKGGGGSMIKVNNGRYIIYLWDAEQRFPMGSQVSIELRGYQFRSATTYDAITGLEVTGWSTENAWQDQTYDLIKRKTLAIAAGGVRILNVVVPNTYALWQTAPLFEASTISDGSGYGSPIADWDSNFFKATCANRNYIMSGLSTYPVDQRMHKQLCQYVPSPNTGSYVIGGTLDNFRARRTKSSWADLWDWDPGYTKWQCGATEVVTGISQSPATGEPHALRCSSTAFISTDDCEVRTVSGIDDRGNFDSLDWDKHYPKAECSAGRVVVGVSIFPPSQTNRRIHKLLCCDLHK